MSKNKKRKIEIEGRVFNGEWFSKHLFIVLNAKILCFFAEEWFRFRKNVVWSAILKRITRASLH